ncbi:hypothetical protein IMY05_002G0040600 [Salix suchowensis]|nr:hypothetical protein IMY05_002G0040600 [Salix suchowensis]
MTDPSSSNATPLEEDKKTAFESGNNEEWRKKMEDKLTSQKLWDVVTRDQYERPKDATDLATWSNDRKRRYRTAQKENAKALMLIQQAVGEEIMKEVHVELQKKISTKKPKGSDQERQSAERFEKERFKEPQMVELVATSKDVWDTIKNLCDRPSYNINKVIAAPTLSHI